MILGLFAMIVGLSGELFAMIVSPKPPLFASRSRFLCKPLQLERLLGVDQVTFLADSRNVFAMRYLIIQAVEAMTDLCQHMLARTRGIPCDGYIDCIVKASEHGIISAVLGERLRRLAALRNILVHRYWSVDDARVYVETKGNLSDLTTFGEEIAALVRTLP